MGIWFTVYNQNDTVQCSGVHDMEKLEGKDQLNDHYFVYMWKWDF